MGGETIPESSRVGLEDDLFMELGFDLEGRDKNLRELEVMFGGRVFHYGEYSGTVSDMANSCPAFGDILEQGTPSAAAWLEANDQPVQDKNDEKIDKQIDDPAESNETNKEERVAPPVNKSDNNEAPSQAETSAEARIVDQPRISTEKAQSSPPLSAENSQTPNGGDQKSSHLSQTPSDKNFEASEKTSAAPDARVDQIELDGSDQTSKLKTPASNRDGTTKEANPQESVNEKAIEKTSTANALDVREEPTLADNDFVPPEQYVQQELVEMPDSIDSISESEEEADSLIGETASNSNLSVVEGDDALAFDTDVEPAFGKDAEAESELHLPVETEIDTLHASGPSVLESIADDDSDAEWRLGLDETESELYPAMETEAMEASEVPVIESGADSDLETESILGVMMNEIDGPENNEDVESLDDLTTTSELQAKLPEALELISELTMEASELDVEVSSTELRRQMVQVIEIMEVLENAKTAEECRETLQYIRIELASLLRLLGYENADAIAERLVKQYGMLALKEYVELLMKLFAPSQEIASGRTKQVMSPISPRRYGIHAVQSVVNLTLETLKLQAA